MGFMFERWVGLLGFFDNKDIQACFQQKNKGYHLFCIKFLKSDEVCK
jgi:hypothetical protein